MCLLQSTLHMRHFLMHYMFSYSVSILHKNLEGKEIIINKEGGQCEEVLRIGQKVVVNLSQIGHKYGELHLVVSGVM